MSAADPLVSVFMPTYNQREFIGAAIDSVLAQDYGNLEIVVGDDGSTDGTWPIVQDYQSKYPDRVKASRNERNLGITGNCNEILKRCSGTYIAFHAGDDLLAPGKIRKQVDVMENDKSVVLCYHDVEVFDSPTNTTIKYWNHGPLSTAPRAGTALALAKAIVSEGTSFMAALSVMVRAAAVPASGFDKRIVVASDWMFWIELLANASPDAKVAFLSDVLARYRKHDSNVTSTNPGAWYYADALITLALVESNYPWLIDDVVRFQLGLRFSRGIRLIRDGDRALGRALLLQSARAKRLSLRWYAWLAVSYFPALGPRLRRKETRTR